MENKDISKSKFTLDNFEELIKNPKYKFKEPEFNDDGQVNMFWEFEEE